MIYNGKEVEFPAVLQVSLFRLIDQLEQIVNDQDKDVAHYASQLLLEVEKHPELKDGIDDLNELSKYEKSFKKIGRVLFPDVLLSNEIKILTPPFHFSPLYKSTRFDNIIKDSGGQFEYKMKDVDEDTFYLYCCYFILGKYYGYPTQSGPPLKLEIFNKNQNLLRSYKMLINADMTDFIPTETAIDISQKDYEELMDNFGNMEVWKKKFPPNSWIMRGVNLVSLVDTTVNESMNAITSNLLIKSNDTFEKIREGLRGLLNNANLEIGLLAYDNNEIQCMGKDHIASILLGSEESLNCKAGMCEHNFNTLLKQKEPIVIPDVDKFLNTTDSQLAKRLDVTKFESYLIIPLLHEDELLGFIEFAAYKKYQLNKSTIFLLEDVIPIMAMAYKRFKEEAQNRVEAIIQQECTTIHPSVKWRFEEQAEKFMNQELNNEQPVFKDIIFNNLYPLYGQMDIKGSSVKRNKAVSHDLVKQIEGVNKVLSAAFIDTEMPIYEELLYRLDEYKNDLLKGLSAGSEHRMLSFLRSDVYPAFDHLKQSGSKFRKLVEEYEGLLDPDLKTVYEERKKYDTSVNKINHKLASYLDTRQRMAQKMFPHYFERYKTDGVEYNMYIGQSITQEDNFNQIHLKNLRLWQLLVMCEMENEFKVMQKELETHIELASLILVYSTSLSVHFRMDEKRFDVEGAYNARYEIIKKRVDKAHIKGTKERITQPGYIAIIYSQDSDAVEYREYLHFLSQKGYIEEHFEDLELEDLQGISGLRALRVKLTFEDEVIVEELMKSVEVTKR